MNIKLIRSLAQIVREGGLTALEITEGDSHIRLERQVHAGYAAASDISACAATDAADPQDTVPAHMEAASNTRGLHEMRAPMVGVFYASPSPDALPFVKAGDTVRQGDVLCIIEAMKLMNEITAETDGEIAEICVENGEVVEFGQPLFMIKRVR